MKKNSKIKAVSVKSKRLQKTSQVLKKKNLSWNNIPRERESLMKINSRFPKKEEKNSSVFSEEILWNAWQQVYRSKTKKKRRFSRGIDNVSIEDFKGKDKIFLQDIYRQIEGDFFVFDELFNFQIKKKNKKPRDIQSPTIKDRIIQKIINDYLVDNHFRNLFNKFGIVGSVKGNSIKSIIEDVLNFNKEGYVFILKTDIIKYFPSINVSRLRNVLNYYIKDKELKKYLYKYLEVSKMSGIAQGPPLSPLMANLYLLDLDKKLAMKKKIKHVRYVDDLLIFCKSREEAIRQYYFIKKYFKKVYLDIHELGPPDSKTKIDKFDSGNIDVLGVVFRNNQFLIKKDKLSKFENEVVAPLQRMGSLPEAEKAFDQIFKLVAITNDKIIGWGGSYSFCNVNRTFVKIDEKIKNNLNKLCDKLRITKSQREIILKRIKKISALKFNPIIKL